MMRQLLGALAGLGLFYAVLVTGIAALTLAIQAGLLVPTRADGLMVPAAAVGGLLALYTGGARAAAILGLVLILRPLLAFVIALSTLATCSPDACADLVDWTYALGHAYALFGLLLGLGLWYVSDKPSDGRIPLVAAAVGVFALGVVAVEVVDILVARACAPDEGLVTSCRAARGILSPVGTITAAAAAGAMLAGWRGSYRDAMLAAVAAELQATALVSGLIAAGNPFALGIPGLVSVATGPTLLLCFALSSAVESRLMAERPNQSELRRTT